jgi:hypothetical protein
VIKKTGGEEALVTGFLRDAPKIVKAISGWQAL